METSNKSRLVALLLWLIFGAFSAHRFYAGKVRTAILQMVTFGGFFIWLFIDGILIVTGNFSDKQGKKITKWTD